MGEFRALYKELQLTNRTRHRMAEDTKQAPPSRLTLLLIALALMASILIFFSQTFRFGFINFGDYALVHESAQVKEGLSGKTLKWAFTSFEEGQWAPAVRLSFLLEGTLFGTENPMGYHVVSVWLHFLNVILIGLILWKSTDRFWTSVFAAGLFALHPLSTEAVGWISRRGSLLTAFWLLFSLLAYVLYARRKDTRWYVASLVGAVLCALCSPVAFLIPFLFLLFDAWPLQRWKIFPDQEFYVAGPRWDIPGLRGLFIEKLPFLLIGVPVLGLFLAPPVAVGSAAAVDAVPNVAKLGNVLWAYGAFLGKTVTAAETAVIYPYPEKIPTGQPVVSAIAIIAGSYVVFRNLRRRKYLAIGWFWLLLTPLFDLGLHEFAGQPYAQRFTYLPLVGPVIILSFLSAEIISKIPGRWAVPQPVIAVVALVTLEASGVIAHFQLRRWSRSVRLWEHNLKITPINAIAEFKLARALWDEGNQVLALTHYEKAVQTEPAFVEGLRMYGLALMAEGRSEQALEPLFAAREHAPEDSGVRNALGMALAKNERAEEALSEFNEALRLSPDDVEPITNAGTVLHGQEKHEEAISLLQRAVEISPGHMVARLNLAAALLAVNQGKEAIPHLERALELDPGNKIAHYRLGVAQQLIGETEKAVATYNRTLDLDPFSIEALGRLAWLHATHPDPKFRDPDEAIKKARRACEASSYRAPKALDILAVAYAAAGRFSEAVSTAGWAEGAARERDMTDLADEIESRRKLFEKGEALVTSRPYQ